MPILCAPMSSEHTEKKRPRGRKWESTVLDGSTHPDSSDKTFLSSHVLAVGYRPMAWINVHPYDGSERQLA